LYDMFQENYPYEQDHYKVEGLKVFCGLEVDVKENGHFLVIGSRDDIVTISHLLLPYHDKEAFIPVQDLIDVLNDFNVIKIGSQPLRKDRKSEERRVVK